MLGLVDDGLCQALYAECPFIGLRAVRITAIDGGWKLNIRGDSDDPKPPILHMKVRNVGVGRIRSSRISRRWAEDHDTPSDKCLGESSCCVEIVTQRAAVSCSPIFSQSLQTDGKQRKLPRNGLGAGSVLDLIEF